MEVINTHRCYLTDQIKMPEVYERNKQSKIKYPYCGHNEVSFCIIYVITISMKRVR